MKSCIFIRLLKTIKMGFLGRLFMKRTIKKVIYYHYFVWQ